jgi:acyl carrier protein
MAAPEALADARSREDIFASLATLIQKEFGFGPEEISLGTDLIDDLDFDSIDAIDMAVRIEELTGTGISEEDLRSVRTMHDVVELLFARIRPGSE